MKDLECPVDPEKKEQVLDWLLGHAVRLEYSDKGVITFTYDPRYWVKPLLHIHVYIECKGIKLEFRVLHDYFK